VLINFKLGLNDYSKLRAGQSNTAAAITKL